jgi:hypothetical protein
MAEPMNNYGSIEKAKEDGKPRLHEVEGCEEPSVRVYRLQMLQEL